jgi:hypothetical protein
MFCHSRFFKQLADQRDAQVLKIIEVIIVSFLKTRTMRR